jgi:hypothetical protein
VTAELAVEDRDDEVSDELSPYPEELATSDSDIGAGDPELTLGKLGPVLRR